MGRNRWFAAKLLLRWWLDRTRLSLGDAALSRQWKLHEEPVKISPVNSLPYEWDTGHFQSSGILYSPFVWLTVMFPVARLKPAETYPHYYLLYTSALSLRRDPDCHMLFANVYDVYILANTTVLLK